MVVRNLLVKLLDLGAHLDAQLGVEIRQRLVEQEHLRFAHDGAAHRDALPLAAGELVRLAIKQVGDVEDAGGVRRPGLISAFGNFCSRSPNDMFSYTVMCGYSA